MEVLSENPVTDAEARSILEERGKSSELKYEQKNALATLKKFSKTKLDKLQKMVEELKTLGKLRDKQIIEIANLLPEDKDDLRLILQKEYSLFSEEEIDKILNAVNGS